MKNRLTLFLILYTLGIILLVSILSALDQYLHEFAFSQGIAYLPFVYGVIADLVWVASFCALIWFMWTKASGAKTPPALMLALGLLGLGLRLIYLLGAFTISNPFLFISVRHGFLYSLYIVFGAAGLFIKPHAA